MKTVTEPPFVVAGKVEPPYFIGREEELENLGGDARTGAGG
ncbi:MAG: hypothetical protein ACE5OR_07335 [bacterium]